MYIPSLGISTLFFGKKRADMKVRILNRSDKKMSFILDDSTPPFANSLRRIMVSEIPVLAIDNIEVSNNTSILFDEIIAHRLGLVPLAFDPKKFSFSSECSCKNKGCPSCEVAFALEKTGPCMVYSGDLKSTNKDVEPTDPKFVLAELLENQKLKFDAYARLGKGLQHAKWQAATVSYGYYPELEITNQEKFAKYIKKLPDGLFAAKGGKTILTDLTKLDFYKKCEEECDAIKINVDDTKFVFTVESISGLEPAYIVSKAAEILEEKAGEFKKELAELK